MKKLIGILFFIALSTIPVFLEVINEPASSAPKVNRETLISASALPESVGLKSFVLNRIDSIAKNGIQNKVYPGCQILIMKDGKRIYDKCFGNYTYDGKQKVTESTLYDLASLTKTTATLLAIMKLYDDGQLNLNDKAAKYLNFLQETDKENITITDLLFHETGLPGSLPFHNLVLEKKGSTFSDPATDPKHFIPLNSKYSKYNSNLVSRLPSDVYNLQVSDNFYLHKSMHDKAMKMIATTHLGEKSYLYSCINFILLKEIAESISGVSIDRYLNEKFYSPMNLKNIAFLPLNTHKKEDIAPTLQKDFFRNGKIQGFVHDPAAAFLGGISGNAGLFATAEDMATIYQMLLNDGELNGTRYLSAKTCKLFTTTVSKSGKRGLGFDKPTMPTAKNNLYCSLTPKEVYGHTGYTGTCCWVDPLNKIVYVFLSNRTYPDDGVNKLAKMSIRSKIQDTIYKSIKKN